VARSSARGKTNRLDRRLNFGLVSWGNVKTAKTTSNQSAPILHLHYCGSHGFNVPDGNWGEAFHAQDDCYGTLGP
jgi:hypothetical protein